MKNDSFVRAIGIDIHKDSYSIAAYAPSGEKFFAECTTSADAKVEIIYPQKASTMHGFFLENLSYLRLDTFW